MMNTTMAIHSHGTDVPDGAIPGSVSNRRSISKLRSKSRRSVMELLHCVAATKNGYARASVCSQLCTERFPDCLIWRAGSKITFLARVPLPLNSVGCGRNTTIRAMIALAANSWVERPYVNPAVLGRSNLDPETRRVVGVAYEIT